MRFRPAPLLTLLTLAALATLLALGDWQWRRMAQKQAAFAEIAAARARPAAPLASALAADPAPAEFARVRVAQLGSAAVATWGREGRVFQTAPLNDGRAILVETARGGEGAADAVAAPTDGVLRRMPNDGPANDPAAGVFYRPGPDMAPALGLAPQALRPDFYVALERIEDRARPGPPALVDNPRADPRARAAPPARHLGYALTWWGLAIGLTAVYLALHVRMGRLTWARAEP